MDEQVNAEVIAIEHRRTAATVAVDLAALEAIYDDELVYVHTTGKLDDKETILSLLERNRHVAALERGELSVVTWGDTAVMFGPIQFRFKRSDGTERELSAYATQTFRRTKAGWRVVSFQSTPVNPA